MLTYTYHVLGPATTYELDVIIILIFQLRKLRHKEAK